MDDSNQTQQTTPTATPPPVQAAQPNPTPTAPAAAPAQPQPKTFLQQFQEVLQKQAEHENMLQQTEMAFSLAGAALQQITQEQMLINDQLQALYLLSEDKQPITRVNVASRVNQLRVDAAKAKLKKDEEAGIIRKIPAVLNDASIIVYDDETNKLAYAYNPAGKFGPQLASKLLGKKPGDVVDTVKIIDIYEMVPEDQQPKAPAPAPTDAPKAQ